MLKDVNRRLRALEGSQRATKGAEFDHLMALARAGQLDEADLARLSDEQLWWLVAQEPIALPPNEQLERKLREVTSEQG
jgi:hypothetical protein